MADKDPTPPSANEDEGSAEGRFSRAKEFVGDKYSAASDKVKETYSGVKEKVGAGYGKVREKVDDIDFKGLTEQTRAYIRSNPGKSLIISVGVGFIIGLLLRSGDDEE